MNYFREAMRDYFAPVVWMHKRLKERSLLHQIRKLIERNEAMLQNLDTLNATLSSISNKLTELVTAQSDATSTAVQAGVNTALSGIQTQVDSMLAAAQTIESALTSAVAAAKG
jgi:hypothetical protein